MVLNMFLIIPNKMVDSVGGTDIHVCILTLILYISKFSISVNKYLLIISPLNKGYIALIYNYILEQFYFSQY